MESPQDAQNELPAVDVVTVLLQQHEQIRVLLAEVASTRGGAKQEAFDRLRELLARHETGEEIVLRPVSADLAGGQVVQERNDEEQRAAAVLTQLEKLDVDSAQFTELFSRFQQDVRDHAEREERDEFPAVLANGDPETLRRLARRLLAAQKAAPSHPHPATAGGPRAVQIVAGPFAVLVDKMRDAFSQSGE